MKEIKFRPLRRIKKTGKVVVASYMQYAIQKINETNFKKLSNEQLSKILEVVANGS